MKHIPVIIVALFLPFVFSGCDAVKDILFSSGSALFDNHMVDARTIGYSISPHEKNIIFSANGDGGAGIFCLNLKRLKVTTIIDTERYEYLPTIIPQTLDVVFL